MTERIAERASESTLALEDRIAAPLHGFHGTGRLLLGEPTATEAIVFVHGFRGHPDRTWGRMLEVLEQEYPIARFDLYMFGYESVFQRAYDSALDFLALMRLIDEQPGAYIKKTTGTHHLRAPGWRYSRVIIVAHSLGAMVVRLALVEAARTDSGFENVRLVLLAPAHMGSNVPALAREALGELKLGFLSPIAVMSAPVLDDLREDSSILQHLRKESERLSGKGPRSAKVIANSVGLAWKDPVVLPTPFPGDPPGQRIRGHGHMSITRPTAGADPVVSFVTACL